MKHLKSFKIYNFMITELGLGANNLLIYAYIYDSLPNPLQISIADIAEALNLSKVAVIAVLKRLKDWNVITIEKTQREDLGSDCNIYRIEHFDYNNN